MTYVEPTTNIQFFSGMNLSPSYENTLYFASERDKNNYFAGVSKTAVVNNCTYQRERRGYIRVQVPIATLYTADYMRFQNPLFENKWFYAFVMSVNYINNITTEVEYQLDPMMTWMGTFELGECYIDRQHASDDTIGANIVDEGLPTGEYVVEEISAAYNANIDDWKIVVGYLSDNDITGDTIGGIYTGAGYKVFDNATDTNAFLTELLQDNRIDDVVSIYMMPDDIYLGATGQGGTSIKLFMPYSDINGYVPKNNKLFTYPYKYLLVDNMEGQQETWQYEYMRHITDTETQGTFTWADVNSCYNGGNCEAFFYLEEYKGRGAITGGSQAVEKTANVDLPYITKKNFPLCSFSYDTYKAWLAQQNAYYPLDFAMDFGHTMINSTVGALGSGAEDYNKTGIFGGSLTSENALLNMATSAITVSATKVYDNIVKNNITPTTPNRNVGTPTPNAITSNSANTFFLEKMCITEQYAKMIDDYFTMYGYAQKCKGTPNMNVRSFWTYCKTIGCQVKGNIPADDARDIEKIFDSGVRFWKNHTLIGNYDLTNAILS